MKKTILISFISTLFLLTSVSLVLAADYQHSIDLKKLQLSWSVEGDMLKVQVSGQTEGWVAVGFNATSQMKDANIIIGQVRRGRVKISDEFGSSRIGHKSDRRLKGKNNLKDTAGSEENGVTTIRFTIPLNSGDRYDGVIKPDGNSRVIVATGTRDSFRLGHNFQATLDVNLSTGKYQMQ